MLPNAKLSIAEKQITAGWLPYYAGYSRKFVEEAISNLALDEKDLIIDPWAGSGTTGLVAQRANIQCVCIDINPVVAFISGARLALHGHNAANAKKLTSIVEEAVAGLLNGEIDSGKSLLGFFSKKVKIQAEFISAKGRIEFLDPSFCLLAGVAAKAARSTLAPATSKNPTWRHVDGSEVINGQSAANLLLAEWNTILASEVSVKPKVTSLQIIGDSRNLLIPNEVASAIICSPPYLTRIDYAMHTKVEHDWMFGEDSLREIRESTMGAPIVRGSGGQSEIFGLAGDILASIQEHKSYAARRYYAKTYAQYFSDCARSLSEIHRVLKRKGVALIVVQNSHFKELEIPLSEIYLDMWVRNFGAGEIVSRHEVNQSMVSINRAAKRSLPKRQLYEDVVALYK